MKRFTCAPLAVGLIFLMIAFPKAAVAETLPLPPGLIGLDSEEGEALLFEAEARAAFFPLTLQFVTQQNQAFCGVASVAMVLNALKVPAPETEAWKPFRAFTRENLLNETTEKIISRCTAARF